MICIYTYDKNIHIKKALNLYIHIFGLIFCAINAMLFIITLSKIIVTQV